MKRNMRKVTWRSFRRVWKIKDFYPMLNIKHIHRLCFIRRLIYYELLAISGIRIVVFVIFILNIIRFLYKYHVFYYLVFYNINFTTTANLFTAALDKRFIKNRKYDCFVCLIIYKSEGVKWQIAYSSQDCSFYQKS